MPGIVLAWLTGEGIIFWRSWKQDRRFPVPGQLLAASAIFAMLGALAQVQRAQFLATALAWGFDIAALMNVLPQVATGGTNTSTGPRSSGTTQAPGTTTAGGRG